MRLNGQKTPSSLRGRSPLRLPGRFLPIEVIRIDVNLSVSRKTAQISDRFLPIEVNRIEVNLNVSRRRAQSSEAAMRRKRFSRSSAAAAVHSPSSTASMWISVPDSREGRCFGRLGGPAPGA